jgi:Lrp/AsnC ligand binding domain
VKAYILIQAEPGADGKLAREVAEVDGVGRVERVTGPYDLIAEAEWSQAGMRAVLPRIQGLQGVLRVLTSLVLDGSPAPPPVTGVARQAAARGA